jgi:hypothetical protein
VAVRRHLPEVVDVRLADCHHRARVPDALRQGLVGNLKHVARVGGEAIAHAGEQAHEKRDEGGVVREVAVDVVHPLSAGTAAFQVRREVHRLPEAWEARRRRVAGRVERAPGEVHGRRHVTRGVSSEDLEMIAPHLQNGAPQRGVEELGSSSDPRDSLVADLLVRRGHAEDGDAVPEALEAQDLVEDMGLRQPRVAPQYVREARPSRCRGVRHHVINRDHIAIRRPQELHIRLVLLRLLPPSEA